jgi:hypothetical protein
MPPLPSFLTEFPYIVERRIGAFAMRSELGWPYHNRPEDIAILCFG